MLRNIQTISLLDILPDSILADEKIKAIAVALDTELQKVTAETQQVLHLPRLDVLPEKVIDLLAWQFHVDFYEPVSMDIDTKRKLVKESIAWHRIKGTPAAVEMMLSSTFGRSAKVSEWYEYDGEPYHFKVSVKTKKFPTMESLGLAKQGVLAAKNTRSVLDSIKTIVEMDTGDYEKKEDGSEGGVNTGGGAGDDTGDSEMIPVTRKYKGAGGVVRKCIILQPEMKYESPKFSTGLYVAGVVTLHRHTTPSIFRVFGRSRVAVGGAIHRKIHTSFNLGGGKIE